jgi:ABC-type uncharacterized transport system substrate-binding protein
MIRRHFITLLGGAAAWPLTARAQQKVPLIGLLLVRGPEPMGPFHEALRDLGYVEGKTIQIEKRSAEGHEDRLPELAAELVRSKVDVLVASLTPAALAAKAATRDIPIVMAPAGEPVRTGLVASLARPGGNVTGVSGTGAELGAKGLELIRDVLPGVHRVAVLASAKDPFSNFFVEQIQQGGRAVNFDILPVLIHGDDQLDEIFSALSRQRPDAVIIQVTLPVRAVELALKHHIPAFSHQKSLAVAGVLATYSASFAERSRKIAFYIDKILKGANPAELPVQEPDTFELTINLKTAKALGLTIPPTVLARADEVIE